MCCYGYFSIFHSQAGYLQLLLESTDSLNFVVHFGLLIAPQVSLLFIISGKFVRYMYNYCVCKNNEYGNIIVLYMNKEQ